MFRLPLLAALALSLSWNGPTTAADKTRPPGSRLATFEKTVLPILKARCTGCHSGSKPKAGLDLSTRRGVLAGNAQGAVVRLNAAESSRLWGVLASNRMPPKGPKLTAAQKGVIRTRINEGAPGEKA